MNLGTPLCRTSSLFKCNPIIQTITINITANKSSLFLNLLSDFFSLKKISNKNAAWKRAVAAKNSKAANHLNVKPGGYSQNGSVVPTSEAKMGTDQ